MKTRPFLRLYKIDADGPLPLHSIFDDGFMVQLAGFPIKKRLEVYGATSQIFGSFRNSNEYLLGVNVSPFKTRNVRLNCQVIFVETSPVSSVFGYYTGGQSGTTLSAFASILITTGVLIPTLSFSSKLIILNILRSLVYHSKNTIYDHRTRHLYMQTGPGV